MRRTTLFSLLLLAAPAGLAAQISSVELEARAINNFYETRQLALLPNETVGFRILGTAAESRTMRVTTGHLIAGHLYRAVAVVTPRGGAKAMVAEGTISTDAPTLALGLLPAGGYVITMHLEDLATESTRDAKSSVVLR